MNGEEQSNVSAPVAKKAVKRAVRRKVKSVKGASPAPKISKLERIIKKSKNVYRDYVTKIHLLEGSGADISSLTDTWTNAEAMSVSIRTGAELKQFLATSKELSAGIGKIQKEFSADTINALFGAVETLMNEGRDVSVLMESLDAGEKSLQNLKITSKGLEDALNHINDIRFTIKQEMEALAQAKQEEAAVAEKPAQEIGETETGETTEEVAAETPDEALQEEAVQEEAEPVTGEAEVEIAAEEGPVGAESETAAEEGQVEAEEDHGVTEAETGAETEAGGESGEMGEVQTGELEEGAVSGETEMAGEAVLTPQDDEFEQEKQHMAVLVNEVYMEIAEAQKANSLPFTEAMEIITRAGDLVEESRLDEIGALREDVYKAMENEIELRQSVGLKLEKSRKDILAATNRGINLGSVTELFSKARELFSTHSFSEADGIAETLKTELEKVIGDFERTISQIEDVKGTITRAREENLDVGEEMERFRSLKKLISDGEFGPAQEALASINVAILSKGKSLLKKDIDQTRAILEKAPSYIDITEPMQILTRANEELENNELEKAAESVKESKDLAMVIRERYLELVENSKDISVSISELTSLDIDTKDILELYSSAKDELKNGDFSGCEEHFREVMKAIDVARDGMFDVLSERINKDLSAIQDELAEIRKTYPDMDISDLLDENVALSHRYDKAENVPALRRIVNRLEDFKTDVEEKKKEIINAQEEQKRIAVENRFKETEGRARMLLSDVRPYVSIRKQEKMVNEAVAVAGGGDFTEAQSLIDRVYGMLVEMKKELDRRVEIGLEGKGFERGVWGETRVKVCNFGSFTLTDLTIKLEGSFEVRREIHFDVLEPQELAETSIAMKFTEVGRMPVDIKMAFTTEQDGVKREKDSMGWVEVGRDPPFKLFMPLEDKKPEPERKEKKMPVLKEIGGEEKKEMEKISTLDICPVCKEIVGSGDLRYLCGCNQMYHKPCAEKVNNNSCLTCGVALFEVDNMILITCPICRMDIWYDDEIIAHDCGEYYHRDCILGTGTCKNCYAPVDGTTGFLCSTCLVCGRMIKDDGDYRKCRCGEPYHGTCYRRVNYCVRCAANLNPNVEKKKHSVSMRPQVNEPPRMHPATASPSTVSPAAVSPSAASPTAVSPSAASPTAVSPSAASPTAVPPSAASPVARSASSSEADPQPAKSAAAATAEDTAVEETTVDETHVTETPSESAAPEKDMDLDSLLDDLVDDL